MQGKDTVSKAFKSLIMRGVFALFVASSIASVAYAEAAPGAAQPPAAPAGQPALAGLEARVASLEAEVQALKAELAQRREAEGTKVQVAERQAVPAPSMPAQPTSDALAAPVVTAATGIAAGTEAPRLSWFGYGELDYARPADQPGEARLDLARFVLGAGYRFDERTTLQSELEIEHAVSSADDPGEVEVEQLYIARELGAGVQAKLGLFLIPSGLLNENHEPTRYYGVFRNHVETAIIPSTWREGGIGLQGNTGGGLRWDLGVTTGFDLSKWDAASGDGAESPLGAIHQELALARAADLSVHGALNYTGITGLRIGASLFGGGVGQHQPGFAGSRLALWEAHAAWQPGAWDLAALYARGHIGNTAVVNRTLVGNPTLVPEDFFGWYVQAAWRGLAGSAWPVAPFLRYERFNTASGYAALGAGLTPVVLPDRRAITGGAQWTLAPGVVLKADYVDFAGGAAGDRLDLGLGYEF